MKKIKLLPLLFVFTITSCSSIRVASDYDENVDFNQYKTFAFYKEGVDKVEISDLDKKRILRAIDEELIKKGFTKSETPDLLINIFTKSRQQVDIHQFNAGWGYGWGWGWNPWMWGGSHTAVSTSTEGTLYIDFIDAKKKEMIWQGAGRGVLTQNRDKKQEKIKQFVSKIIAEFPPKKK